ncbi:MAG TPA: type II toxin-antitoxin system VapC family toxin [Candidatus Acidoferrum sp.]|nr:type II toxin-antitoxin system VapC family toxin [Candidatus Acidoferrum sp.]
MLAKAQGAWLRSARANLGFESYDDAEHDGALPTLVLVDTSVWVDHLRQGNAALATLLNRAEVESHPFVIGELACEFLHRRHEVLPLLERLPSVPVGSHSEVMMFVESNHLMGAGIGWIDAHLLVSASLAQVPLWTRDLRLAKIARMLQLYAEP